MTHKLYEPKIKFLPNKFAKTLINFIKENEIVLEWRNDKLITWIEPYMLSDFSKIIDKFLCYNTEFNVQLHTDGFICFDMIPIAKFYEIDPEEIEPKPIKG